jgi:hypothetical protein
MADITQAVAHLLDMEEYRILCVGILSEVELACNSFPSLPLSVLPDSRCLTVSE